MLRGLVLRGLVLRRHLVQPRFLAQMFPEPTMEPGLTMEVPISAISFNPALPVPPVGAFPIWCEPHNSLERYADYWRIPFEPLNRMMQQACTQMPEGMQLAAAGFYSRSQAELYPIWVHLECVRDSEAADSLRWIVHTDKFLAKLDVIQVYSNEFKGTQARRAFELFVATMNKLRATRMGHPM